MGSMFRVLSRAVWSPCQYSTHVCMGSGFSSLSLGIKSHLFLAKNTFWEASYYASMVSWFLYMSPEQDRSIELHAICNICGLG